MEINVPLVIGSVPRHNHTEPQKGRGITDNASTLSVDRYDLEKGVLYLQNRRERPVHLAEPNKIYAYTSKSQVGLSLGQDKKKLEDAYKSVQNYKITAA